MTEGGTDSLLIGRTIGPNLVGAVLIVVGLSHPCDRCVGGDAPGKIKAVIRWQESARTRPLPFMGVTEALAHGPTYEGCFAGSHPDDRVLAGDIGELKLIDTGSGIFGFFGRWIIERRHILCPTNLLEFLILIVDGQLAELFPSPSRGYWVFGYCRVSLTDVAGFPKYGPNGIHLLIG